MFFDFVIRSLLELVMMMMMMFSGRSRKGGDRNLKASQTGRQRKTKKDRRGDDNVIKSL